MKKRPDFEWDIEKNQLNLTRKNMVFHLRWNSLKNI